MNDNNFKTIKAGILENSTFDELKKEIGDFELSKPLTKVDIELNEKILKSISEEYDIPEDKIERLLNSIVVLD